ncbi:MAG: TraR/DksA C4-type zinc finger protein [Opitutales bacterium]|nr:TraR/DksA C4-type zinc finger protein [Opitutales bacterium]
MAKKNTDKKSSIKSVEKSKGTRVAVKSKVSTKLSAKESKMQTKISAKKEPAVKINISVKKKPSKQKQSNSSVKISAVKNEQLQSVVDNIISEETENDISFSSAIRDDSSWRVDKASHHIAFTLEDLDAYFKDMANNVHPKLAKKESDTPNKKKVQPKKTVKGVIKLENKSEGVATIFDLLGFNPVEAQSIEKLESKDVPRKWKKYYNKLIELRNHHSEGVASRSEEVMQRSAKEDAGDLSSNGQHLADAGSASFERDLAYNMISNQTEMLAEIEAALKRIKDGTYGVCEVTGKPIPESRLDAVPFTRYTKEGQEIHELEISRVKSIRRESVFDMGMDSTGQQKSDDDDIDTGM